MRLTLSGLLVVVLSGGAVAATAEIGVSKVPKPKPFPTADAPETDPTANPGSPQTLLLTGLDHRYADGKGTPSRSDTMMLVRLDPEANATTMLSLPRDLEVPIVGYGTAPQKLNAAWALGNGPKVLTKTIRTSLLGTPQDPFRINGVVAIRFDAFSKAVNELGCIYTDVDRKYLVAPGAGYAQIDQPAGYQLLCGQDALAYVRFRHADSDITREARQANFLADMRTQVDAQDALTGGLLGAIEPFVQSTIQGNRQFLRIAKLLVGVAGKPTKRVKLATTFTADGGVATTPEALARARRQFMDPPKEKKAKPSSSGSTAKAGASRSGSSSAKRRKRRPTTALPPTMIADKPGAEQVASLVGSQTSGLPIWAPTARLSAGVYESEASRGYEILDKKRRPKWPAYRIVVQTQDAGEYYGVEGTTWKDPPILKLASGTVRLAGRTWKVQYDGGRIRRLFWQSPGATYWISNTLGDDLTPREMYALARTFARRSASSGAAAGTTSSPTPTTPDPAAVGAPATSGTTGAP
ncbi:LCP family protein [Patulibacter minatonensis]|uniref:LCP family protein n=1 Tax=Patulibacter minatonensis TaxID=298163 RepID=UPI00047CE809|nr:LCP family protein [Patulibacter minatonensis]